MQHEIAHAIKKTLDGSDREIRARVIHGKRGAYGVQVSLDYGPYEQCAQYDHRRAINDIILYAAAWGITDSACLALLRVVDPAATKLHFLR